MMSEAGDILEVRGLVTAFDTDGGRVTAVDGVSFTVPAGKTVGIVGESGCGKSVTAMSVIRLLPQPMGHVLEGSVRFNGEELTQASEERMREVRGGEIGVVFQEPMTALNPVQRVGKQLMEGILLHKEISKQEAMRQAVGMLKKVGIPAPERRAMEYPHQLSGGMRQRVVIAMALACDPALLIADEPTTALDVTVQAQILELIEGLQEESGMSVVLITHDLGVIAHACDEVVVMYAGRVVEQGPVREIFKNPRHAYTKGLMGAIPSLDYPRKTKLPVIPGQVAAIWDFVEGCRFCQRMERKGETLRTRPRLVEVGPDHLVANCPVCAG